MEIYGALLWAAIHSTFCVLLHFVEFQGSCVWFRNCSVFPHLPPFWVDQLTDELVMVLGRSGLGHTPYRCLLRPNLVCDFAHFCHLCSCRY